MTERRKLDILYLQSECLLNYSKKTGKSLSECANIFYEYGVFDYITRCYDVLHLSGPEYILKDIVGRIKGGVKFATSRE